MSLIVSNPDKLYVADKDIEVFKEINLNDKITPYQNTEVELNNYLIAEGEKSIDKKYEKYSVSFGYIHAYLNTNKICVRAFIPKGTKFYIQDDFTEIAAEKLFISDKIISGSNISKDLKYLAELVIDENKLSLDVAFHDFKVVLEKNFGIGSHYNAEILLEKYKYKLPTIEQLETISKYMLCLNAISIFNDYPVRLSFNWYWSSYLYSSTGARNVNFSNGGVNGNYRYGSCYVLGVSVF